MTTVDLPLLPLVGRIAAGGPLLAEESIEDEIAVPEPLGRNADFLLASMRRDGRLSLQTFAYGAARPRAEALGAASTRFLASEIFEETDPPTLANIAEAIGGTFEIVALENDRLDPAPVCHVFSQP